MKRVREIIYDTYENILRRNYLTDYTRNMESLIFLW